MELVDIDPGKVENVMKIVGKMLEKTDISSSRYNVLLFIKSYSYYLMDQPEESLKMCNVLLEHSYSVNFNKSIVCQTHNLKTMIYMRSGEFTNMYKSIQHTLSLDQNNQEAHKLFGLFKEKLVG